MARVSTGPPPSDALPVRTAGDHQWSDESSRASFELLGDRIIDGTRRWLRNGRRLRLQHDLYTVDGVELTFPQVDALEAVSVHDIRMHELADRLHLDPSTVTRTTAPLVDLGLLERQADPTDRRYVIVRCTPSGRIAAGRIVENRRQLMRDVLESMLPERRLLFAELLEEYLDLIDAYQPGGGRV